MEIKSNKNEMGMKWEMVKLSSVSEVIAGQSPESKYYNTNEEGVPFFQGKADFGRDYPSIRYWCSQPTKMAKQNDILFSVRAPVGPTNICNIPACIGRGLAAIRVKQDLNYKYLYYYFKSIEHIIENQGNGSTFSAITTSVLKDLEIPLPPLPVQKRIAAILDAADALRRKDQELLQKYDELAQAIFIDMFGDPVRNEKGWEVKKLGEVTRMKAGNFIPASDIYPEFNENLFPCYGGNGLRGYVKSFTHEGAFVLIGRQGALCGNVKVTSGKYHATEHAIVCSPKIDYINIWFYYLLDFLNLNKYATGAAQPGLTVSKLEEIEIIVPPIIFQSLFSEKAIKFTDLKNTSKICSNKTDSLFQSLLQKAFKGEL